MSTTELPDLALGDADNVDTGGIMSRVTAELHEIAAAFDRASEASHPTMELLEASRAIQSALVSLGNWRGSQDDGLFPVATTDADPLTLQQAWRAARPADPLDARRSSWPDV